MRLNENVLFEISVCIGLKPIKTWRNSSKMALDRDSNQASIQNIPANKIINTIRQTKEVASRAPAVPLPPALPAGCVVHCTLSVLPPPFPAFHLCTGFLSPLSCQTCGRLGCMRSMVEDIFGPIYISMIYSGFLQDF